MVHSKTMPNTIWMLGFVSMFMDISSELIHGLLPVFFVSTLGISVLTVGVIEGLVESTALIVKVFSGMISDYLGRRKGLLVLGYGLGAFSKPVFALAGSAYWVFVARFIDRIGKGIRGATGCPGCRYNTAGNSWFGLWLETIFGYSGCLYRARIGHRSDDGFVR